jgi:pyruvate, water dikinase
VLHSRVAGSGLGALDEVLEGLRLGDNVVWQVDRLDNYRKVAVPFVTQALREGRTLVYVRFAPHERILPPQPGLVTRELDPRPGFDLFSAQVNQMIEEYGQEAYYVFDNLSSLVVDWATDELLANFFQVTCPYLHELDTVAYFALIRGRHSHHAVARIRDTTQVLIDLYHVKDQLYIHPLKVWDRYSSTMFMPHLFSETRLTPMFQSGDASSISTTASKTPLRLKADSIAPWDSVYRKLAQYDEDELREMEGTMEIQALKQELSQMIIGTHPGFKRIADHYLTLQDLLGIRNRLIGSGRIGGKAAGMLLARRILLSEPGEIDFSTVLEEHDSFFIGSDVFFTFLVNNDLFRLRLRLTRNSQIAPEEFEKVEERFLAGEFPPEIMEQFKDLLDYFGQAPIIVRSSSLLEDGFGNSFAGKYRSEFCANQGGPEERMKAFLRAVKLTYASAVNPDALAYRRRRGLGESDEQMAILVQRVSGMRYREYFFPPLAGVAFSHNLYRWTDRIDPNQGIIRLVFGLGTRAVNRVGGDYPRLIPVSHPRLRPEMGLKVATYSQRKIDLLDLSQNEFVVRPLREIIDDTDYPHLQLFVSMVKDGYVNDPDGLLSADSKAFVFTFNNLISRTAFIETLRTLLATLERAYGYPVDTEFTAAVNSKGGIRINLVQCRPMRLPGLSGVVGVPEEIPPDRVLFKTYRTLSGGSVKNIKTIVYLDPQAYAREASLEIKKSLGRLVGKLNRHPEIVLNPLMLMGPGRWGSSNILLGINTTYSDINHTSVLVEMAREAEGHVPDVSYGTHFFLDLVESQIIYLPLYPDEPGADFNAVFFENAPNTLTHFLPEAGPFTPFLRVIDVPSVSGGKYAHVSANPLNGRAVCFLGPRHDEQWAQGGPSDPGFAYLHETP